MQAEFAEVYGSVDEDNTADAPELIAKAYEAVSALKHSGRTSEAAELERIIAETQGQVQAAKHGQAQPEPGIGMSQKSVAGMDAMSKEKECDDIDLVRCCHMLTC